MIRKRVGTLVAAGAVAVAGLSVVGTAAAAAPAHPAAKPKDCKTWHDKNTYGVKCSKHNWYNAVANCKDGSKQYGPNEKHGRWSYAYCAGHRGLKSGWVYPGSHT